MFSTLEEDSVFDESDVHDTPTGAANKESQTFFARLKRIGGSKSVKYQPVELNAKRSKRQRLSMSSALIISKLIQSLSYSNIFL